MISYTQVLKKIAADEGKAADKKEDTKSGNKSKAKSVAAGTAAGAGIGGAAGAATGAREGLRQAGSKIRSSRTWPLDGFKRDASNVALAQHIQKLNKGDSLPLADHKKYVGNVFGNYGGPYGEFRIRQSNSPQRQRIIENLLNPTENAQRAYRYRNPITGARGAVIFSPKDTVSGNKNLTRVMAGNGAITGALRGTALGAGAGLLASLIAAQTQSPEA